VLGALPFLLFAFLWFSNRDYLEPLITNIFGQIAIGVGILLMAGGLFWLKKIVDIEI
jgi:Flp pilus assembly protein TadB